MLSTTSPKVYVILVSPHDPQEGTIIVRRALSIDVPLSILYL